MVGNDIFLLSLPEYYNNHIIGFTFETILQNGNLSYELNANITLNNHTGV